MVKLGTSLRRSWPSLGLLCTPSLGLCQNQILTPDESLETWTSLSRRIREHFDRSCSLTSLSDFDVTAKPRLFTDVWLQYGLYFSM